ncbi:MAG: hypothetical protein DVB28_001906 [Verrucomicrobia bacterium]|nr:MAG: hypothetical protein DVB28_001906 [Verrucomicrobiota bacterium]
MGFLKSSIQVRARYKRCKSAWEAHLEQTRVMVLRAAQLAPRRRKALVFGAGLLHDIPLRQLSEMFELVVLADIVHLWPCRLEALRYGNVKLLRCDATGALGQLSAAARRPALPPPASRPREFLDDSVLDFTVSVNLLSQLGWVPGLFLGKSCSADQIDALKSQFISAHLEYLRRLPGHTSLITDTVWSALPQNGTAPAGPTEEWDVLSGVCLPEPDHAWNWSIAPAPERSPHTDYTARVHAYTDWKSAFG